MAKKKNTKKNTLIEVENKPSEAMNNEVAETITEDELDAVCMPDESDIDHKESDEENNVEPAYKKVEEVVPKPTLSKEQQAVKDFCDFWNGLKNHSIISDKEARQIHSYWQIVFNRTDYYTQCGVCSANRIKALKKKAKVYGYECSK